MKARKMSFSRLVFLLAVFTVASANVSAQRVDLRTEAYIQPPEAIASVVTAPWWKNVTLRNLSPDGDFFIIEKKTGLPDIQIYAKPYVNLAGVEFDYLANRARGYTLRRFSGFEIFNWKTGKRLSVPPPKNGWTSNATWSPDGTRIAYFGHTDQATHLYVFNVRTGKTRRITRQPVLATMVSFQWAQDSRHILIVLVPKNRKPRPKRNPVATSPKIRFTNDGKTPNRTFPHLLRTPYEKDLLEWLVTGQLALVDVRSRRVKLIGEPKMYTEISLSPDGNYILARVLQRPFAYTVPLSNFGTVTSVYDLNGKALARVDEQKLRYSTIGNQDQSRKDAPRHIQWRPDGKGLSFLQREPQKKPANRDHAPGSGGEPEKAGRKDRVLQWLPPFDSTRISVIYESGKPIREVYYSQDCQTLFITRNESGKLHLFAVELADTSKRYTIFRYKTEDIYRFPGSLVLMPGKLGGKVVRLADGGDQIFLTGTRYSKESMAHPPVQFLFRVHFKTGEKDTVFMGTPDTYEAITTLGRRYYFRWSPPAAVLPVADREFVHIFTTRQRAAEVPNSFVRNLQTGEIRPLTRNTDFTPEITRAKRYRFQVKRVDGFKFWVRVTLPPGYEKGTRLPAMFWFYPREFTDQKSYDRYAARYNKNAFHSTSPRNIEALIKLGYAVVQPDCPIVGPKGKMNNHYVPDIRNNLWAVIDFLDKKGFIDRDRLAIGGHSYGAFGTANALIHTPFFKAGIAGDGNYNRSLTPITFQNERRFLWDAREVYIRMSPLFWADELNGALLMYHGEDDNNTGTFLINSERMFHVLDGLGKKAALYIYPYEHHGPATRQTLLDLWARWIQWLDKYVKHAGK